MNIIGPDALVFGVDELDDCADYLTAFGLSPVGVSPEGGLFESLDGTGIVIRDRDDSTLPTALASGNMLRQTVYGVADESTLVDIADELARDRQVRRLDDGAVESTDDMGIALRFQVTVRRKLEMSGERINSPGAAALRKPNELGISPDIKAIPRTLSHVVYFVPDTARAAAFYVDRLGFKVTDTLLGAGPFLRPAGTQDHHTLFFIQTPPFMQGCEHLAFHMAGPTELMVAGSRFSNAGYQSFWGPGRHNFGSNWFWYFNSPLGCHFEYDADMDLHDDAWTPRAIPMNPGSAQAYLLQLREKWLPGGPPPGANGGPGH